MLSQNFSGLLGIVFFVLTLTACNNSADQTGNKNLPILYAVTGNVVGLSGGGLVLQLNAENNISVTEESFTFPAVLVSNSEYTVTVLTQPKNPNQICSIANGNGKIKNADITDLTITCSTSAYTVNGSITGLTGTGLIMQVNAGEKLDVAANGSAFSFPTAIASSSTYVVSVFSQPKNPTQKCTIANAGGTISNANISDISISCTTNTYMIQGSVTGLADDGLVLQLNRDNNLPVIADTNEFTFPDALPDGSDYKVSVFQQPTRANARIQCDVSNSAGKIAGKNIADINVACIVTYTVSVTVDGYTTGNDMLIRNNGTDDLIINENGLYVFAAGLSDSAPYNVSIVTPNTELKTSCSVANNIGKINGAGIIDVLLFCNDNVAPRIITKSPSDGATQVALDVVVSALFDENMLATTVADKSIAVADTMTPIVGFVSYAIPDRLLSFTSDLPLGLLRKYTVTPAFTITDISGQRLRRAAWTFTTRDGSWGSAKLLELDNVGSAETPQIALDNAGNALAVWQQFDGLRINIWAQSYDVITHLWAVPELIESEDLGDASNVQVAMSPSGDGLAVWEQKNATTTNIWANRYDAKSNTWLTAKLLDAFDMLAYSPQIAMDAAGNGMVVWRQFGTFGTPISAYANRYDAKSGSWGTAELLETDNIQFHGVLAPQIAMDPNGNALAIWSQAPGASGPYNLWSNRFDIASKTWGAAQLIETNNILGNTDDPQIAMDSMGNGMAVWTQNDGTRYQLWYNRFDASAGSWGTAAILNTDSIGVPTRSEIALDAAGNAILVWDQYGDTLSNVWTNRFDISTKTWGTAKLLELDNQGHASFADVAVDPTGAGIAVWNQFDGIQYSVWSNRYDATSNSWGTPTLVEIDDVGKAVSVRVKLDPSGHAIAVWQQRLGNLYNVWANRFE
ncbi:MAG: Ig-like domain-containing protein [Thiohalomonadales bacterium]